MIKTKKGRTRIKGNEIELIADMSAIINTIKNAFVDVGGMTEEKAREKIHFAVEQGFLSDEEIEAEMSGVPDGE